MNSSVFFRFDDIGRTNLSALQFIDLMEALERPYVLAVIPDALDWWMKRRLRSARHAIVFQHGANHKNRSTKDLPDEFPAALGRQRIAEEVRRGRESIERALGISVIGYVPPWNRVSDLALRVLEDEGYNVLSADSILSTALCQLPAQVDVYSEYRPVKVRSTVEIERDIAANLQRAEMVGVVLHPMSVPRENRAQLQEVLRSNRPRMATDSHWRSLTPR